ncbi:hypothetical protein HYT26_02810 [Candidatus Pacearchaeota archaeon]|nr:hypothetical protein [Candidatus Pacearchaeota archaeon]
MLEWWKTLWTTAKPDKAYLNGFDLDKSELGRAYYIIGHYIGKIERNCEIEQIKISLKKSVHGKAFLHEIKCIAETKQGILNAIETDYNLFKALARCLEKIWHESEHKSRTNRQIR